MRHITKDGLNLIKTFEGLATTTAEEVAKDVWNGFKNGRTFIVSGRRMRILYAIRNLAPYRVQQWIVQYEEILNSASQSK